MPDKRRQEQQRYGARGGLLTLELTAVFREVARRQFGFNRRQPLLDVFDDVDQARDHEHCTGQRFGGGPVRG